MTKYFMLSIIGALALFELVACSLGAVPRCEECSPDPHKTLTGAVLQGGDGQGVGGCTLPPQPFKDSDLAGTWVARPGTATDTLILKEDYTYKQIYDDRVTGDHIESPWQKWWIEYRDSGIPYLHLQGMRKCDSTSELCRRASGGGGNRLWYDFCESRVVRMPDEVILIVLGVPAQFTQPPRGIELNQLLAGPDNIGASVFTFQK